MALVYYLDGGGAPAASGNAYGTEAMVTPLLRFHPQWAFLTTAERETLIQDVTAMIDTHEFKGTVISGSQPLQFPRLLTTDTTGEFTAGAQKRRLLRCLAQQLEYNLNRPGVGQVQYSHGNEAMIQRQETLCREAAQSLMIYRTNA